MATKAVDATQLDGDLTSIANAIRQKGGTSAALSFPAGFVSAVQAIPTGITPSGTKDITANGTYDVTNFASAEVNVQSYDECDMYAGESEPSSAVSGDLWVDTSDEAKNVQAYTTPVSTTSTTMADTNMKITVNKTGTYNIYLTAGCNRNSGTYNYRLRKGLTDLVASTTISTTTGVCKVLTNQSLNSGDVLTVGLKSANTSYRAYATLLMIVEQ